MTKWGKTGFTRSHRVLDLPQVRKRKGFRPKKVGPGAVHKGPYQVFMRIRFGLIAEIRTAIATTRNASGLRFAVYELTKNKRRMLWTRMNPKWIYRGRRERLTAVVAAAEERRVSLVRSGWCSGRRWGGSEARRRQQSSNGRALRGRGRCEGARREKKKRTPRPYL